MRVPFIAALCVVLVSALVLSVSAQTAPPGDEVSGSGIGITGEVFSINAWSRADGHSAHGTMSFTITDPKALGEVTARITCLSVNGTVAFVGGRVTSSTSIAFRKNDGVRWFVRDDDNPDDLRIEPTSDLVCTGAVTNSPIQSGNLTVVDN